MKRVLAVALLLWAGAARVQAETLPVVIGNFTGTPADSVSRREFMTAFQEEFAAAKLPCERQVGEQWKPGEPKPHSYVLLDAAGTDDAWGLSITIGVPSEVKVTRPKRHRDDKEAPRARMSDLRTSRGLTIYTAATPPVNASGAQSVPLRFAVYFAAARRVVVPNAKLPGGAYDYPWADAGRVVARAALEALFRARGDLARDERANLIPATRTEPME